MPFGFAALTIAHLRQFVRDRVLHAVFAVALCMLLLVPALSSFSMRQVQELSITLSLSVISLMLLLLSVFLGASTLWRDMERRYTAAFLPLPVSRAVYLCSKFAGIAVFLGGCTIVLVVAAAVVIPLSSAQYPSDLPIAWGNILLAVLGDFARSLLLVSLGMCLATVSTSFFLPFFVTLAVFMAGSASQGVFEYVSGFYGEKLSTFSLLAIKTVYFLLPNFSALDFKVYAVYSLPVLPEAVWLPLTYAAGYTALLLGVAVWSFNRRELP